MKTPTQEKPAAAGPKGSAYLTRLMKQYGCGPVRFTGTPDALYERHLLFDNVKELTAVGARERFEAAARSVRDVLSQRWLRTEKAYQRQNCRRVYYLSLEFLIGRTLANNVTNLLLDPIWSHFCRRHQLEPWEIIQQEPDAGLGHGVLRRLAACFFDSIATLVLPGIGSGLRYEYGIFKWGMANGWQ